MDLVFFRVGFNGRTSATLNRQSVRAVKTSGVRYESSDTSRALVMGGGTEVLYDLGKGFPHEAGCLEFRFKPNFPQTSEQPERTVLRLEGKKGCRITLSFQPIGYAWEFLVEAPGEKRSLRAWYGITRQGKWNHFLLTWDRQARPGAAMVFYFNGKPRYGSMRAAFDFSLRGLTGLKLGGMGDAQVSVDEVAIYTYPLTQAQAGFLSRGFKKNGQKDADLEERIERDERRERAWFERRRTRVKKLEGKVGSLLQLRGHESQEIELPEGIRTIAIRPEDVGNTDLSRFSVIHFPPGGGYQLTDEERKTLVDYVERGGGYVGVCQGAYHAHRSGILNFDSYAFYEQGLTRVRLEKHPVTEGCGEKIYMHHGNGPIMVPQKGCEAVGVYDMGYPKETMGAVLVGTHGKGRVVLFGPHPRGGGVSAAGKRIGFTGKDLETDRLLVNALLYAAGITKKNSNRSTANVSASRSVL